MFETAELGRKVSKTEFKQREAKLRESLLTAQGRLRKAGFPVVVLFAGVDGAGKGEMVNELNGWMDPHYLLTRPLGDPSPEERERPKYWRFWRDLPPKGQIGLFLSAWYHAPLLDHVFGRTKRGRFDQDLDEVMAFEQTLADDGALILKFWMHLGKKAQQKRLSKLEKDPLESFRVSKTDWKHWRMYDDFVGAAEHIIMRTSTGQAPWHIIEGADANFRSLRVGEILLEALTARLDEQDALRRIAAATAKPETPQLETPQLETTQLETTQLETTQLETPQLETPQLETPQLETPQLETPQLETPQLETPQLETPQLETPQLETPQLETPQLETPQLETTVEAAAESMKAEVRRSGQRTVLDTVDLSATLEKKDYQNRLREAQATLSRQHREAREKDISMVMVFEGWDAAGKGGAIRRLVTAVDARSVNTIPIAAPTDEERAQHYLWRFWRHLSRAGRVTIFDRSWYGRVLVERVEGFASEKEWRRAYAEINDFERQLVERGIVLSKFWLHLSPEEQARRFAEREQTPYKRWKLTEEDWRNRSHWGDYELAVHDMVERTSTQGAPWHLIAGDNKYHARVAILETVVAQLGEALKK